MQMTISVALQDAAAAEDAGLVARLSDLINRVYAVAEAGLWRTGTTRTGPAHMAELIRAGEIAVATLEGEIAGAIRVHAVSSETGEFGMLAAVPECRGRGVGRALVDFAEAHTRDRGLQAMQLELLVPLSWRHPSKDYLDGWYRRMDYDVVRTTRVEENYPELAPLLATPCELRVYAKPLDGARERRAAL